jgi:hypothetical protein
VFHLLAWSVAIGQTADTEVTAVQDDIVFRNSVNRFYLGQAMDLVAAYAGSATINRAKFASASLRQVNFPFIRPVERTVAPPDLPGMMDLVESPFRLPQGEELLVQATSDLACGTERLNVLAWVTTGLRNAPTGDVLACRATSSTAAVANTWTSISYTFDQSLPPGEYAIVGSESISTTGVAHRFIIPNQEWRPGSLSNVAVGNQTHPLFQERRLGQYGVFQHVALPTIQVFCNSTDNSHVLYLYLVRIR